MATEEFPLLLDPLLRDRLIGQIKGLGFQWVTLDLAGYRQGSLNLSHDKK
jgi:PP-loop superfamily ATP-utilizing enzyme